MPHITINRRALNALHQFAPAPMHILEPEPTEGDVSIYVTWDTIARFQSHARDDESWSDVIVRACQRINLRPHRPDPRRMT